MNRVLKQDGRYVAIFTAHRAALVDYATPIVGARARAEDVVQDAYIRFAAAAGRAERIDNPVSYLYRIVRNLAIDVTRRGVFEQPFPEQETLERIPSPAPGAEETLLYRDELRVLAAALDELPARTRDVFLMHRLEGRTLQEIAGHFGISVVRMHHRLAHELVHGAKRLDAADCGSQNNPGTDPGR